MVNLLAKVPRTAQQAVATLVRSIYAQPDPDCTRPMRPGDRASPGPFPGDGRAVGQCARGVLGLHRLPKAVWGQIWSNNPLERLNKEVRRTDVVGIFPNRSALIRLVGAVLAEQNDEWIIARR